MNVIDLESPHSKTRPATTRLGSAPSSVVEVHRLESGQRSESTSHDESETPTTVIPFAGFTSGESRSFQNDDAMATGMIGIILGLAFAVLFSLVAGVSIWTFVVTK